jgi:cytochrome c-type biogenesis protein CcmH/NrfG
MSMPDVDELYMDGLDRFADEDYRSAIDLFRQAAELDPAYVDAWHGIARAAFEAREQDPELLDQAIDAAHRILDLDPDDVTAYSTLSQIYVFKGDQLNAEMWGGKARIAGWKQQLLTDKKRKSGDPPDDDPGRQLN